MHLATRKRTGIAKPNAHRNLPLEHFIKIQQRVPSNEPSDAKHAETQHPMYGNQSCTMHRSQTPTPLER
jgi:hypothetical protein